MKEFDTKGIIQLVTFSLGTEEFSIDILKVQEIIRPMDITRVPGAPEFIEGVINLRGRVIPVMDLRRRLGMQAQEETRDTRIVVVEVGGKTVGLKVDSVSEVLRLSTDRIEPPPSFDNVQNTDCIRGVGKLEDRLIILLDVEKVLSPEERSTLDAMFQTH